MRRRTAAATACAAVALLGWAAPASARLTQSGGDLVVAAHGASVRVHLRPFGLAFIDNAGRTVLSELSNPSALPTPVVPVPDPAPASPSSTPKANTLYAPLTFTVGTQRDVQEMTEWEGDVLTGAMGGVQFSSRQVESWRPEAGGARLTVSTDDPSGRDLTVQVLPGPGTSIHIIASPSSTVGVATMADSFSSPPREAFHGFGGRHNGLDQHGQDLYDWASEENFEPGYLSPAAAAVPGLNQQNYLFPDGPTAAYDPQAMFISSRGYGFLLRQSEISRFRLDSDRPDAWQVSVAAPRLDYLVAPGTGEQAVTTLNAVTGRNRVPPLWALGPQTSQNIQGQDLADGTGYGQRVYRDIADIRKYHQGRNLDAYDVFGWFLLPEATNRDIIARLRAMHIHPLLYFTPFLNVDNAADQQAIDRGYALRTASGQPFLYPSAFGLIGLVDFTNPAAVRWWAQQIDAGLDLGGDGFMEDWGEQVLLDMHSYDGRAGTELHNAYPVLYHHATRVAITAYEASHPGRRIWFYTRSGFSGDARDGAGSQAYDGGNFPGDNNTSWSHANGLASATSDMLNRGLAGAFGYSTDIGGYADTNTPATTAELFTRWVEWATLSPFMRIHNDVSSGTHQPWSYDRQTLVTWDAMAALRRRAVPYLTKVWAAADRTGIPVARPLWLEFPGDPAATQQDQEWMLGDDVLVAPVVTQGATSRAVYFPRGCWQDPSTGQRYRGPRTQGISAPITKLPYYFVCGTRPFRATPATAPRRHERPRGEHG